MKKNAYCRTVDDESSLRREDLVRIHMMIEAECGTCKEQVIGSFIRSCERCLPWSKTSGGGFPNAQVEWGNHEEVYYIQILKSEE